MKYTQEKPLLMRIFDDSRSNHSCWVSVLRIFFLDRDGTKLVQLYYRQIKTEDDVLARALWLERNGHIEQAEELLEEYSANRH